MTRSYRLADQIKSQFPRVDIFDPTEQLCDVARGQCAVTDGEHSLYSYFDHLSDFGAGRVASAILERIDRE